MRVIYAPEAIRDLQEIQESIVEKFADIKLAEGVIRNITKDIRNLEMFPKMGTPVILSNDIEIGYRYLFCKHNYIFYKIDQETICISRVLNEKPEFMRILYGIKE